MRSRAPQVRHVAQKLRIAMMQRKQDWYDGRFHLMLSSVPWFSTIFGRDGIITALLAALGRSARSRAACCAPRRDAGHGVEPRNRTPQPGKILHERARGEMAALGEVPFGRYYGSVDATPLFVMLAGALLRAHRRPRDDPRALAATSRPRSTGSTRYGDPRRRRLRRVLPRTPTRPGAPGLEGLARLHLPCRRRARRGADRALRGAGLRLCGASTRAAELAAALGHERRARALDAAGRAAAQRVRGGVLVRGSRHLRAGARRRQAPLPRAHLQRRAVPVHRHRRAGARAPDRRRRCCSPDVVLAAGACARSRAANRATTRCRITTARSGRTTTR